MRFVEEEIVLISAIEHFAYCQRQCALIHIERIFDENVYTLRGHRIHERTDQPTRSRETGKWIERALVLWSEQYGLYGQADTVEFLDDGTVIPVEYKHGPRKTNLPDDLQLCAQALCLEEMTGKSIEQGAIFHHDSHHRRDVFMTPELRQQTIETIQGVREMLLTERLPEPANDQRCPNCSLIETCVPRVLAAASRTPEAIWHRMLSEDREGEAEWLVNF